MRIHPFFYLSGIILILWVSLIYAALLQFAPFWLATAIFAIAICWAGLLFGITICRYQQRTPNAFKPLGEGIRQRSALGV